MASISTDKKGQVRILFIDEKGGRHSVWLGKASERLAGQTAKHIEHILQSKLTGHAVDSATSRWISELEPIFARKLSKVGLIAGRPSMQLGAFLDDFVDRRTDVKPATKEVWQQPMRNLKTFYGADRDISSISEGDAEDFKLFLIEEGLAPTTVHKRLQFARMFFRAAAKRKLVSENPFADVSAKAVVDSERRFFVTPEATQLLLNACDRNWQVIIALCRIGGLRCPSEVLSLRWQDIDWENQRIKVRSPKTEHHPGKDSRTIPLFDELRTYLEEAKIAANGNEYVVSGSYRDAADTAKGWRNCNLRTQFDRIIRRAGLEPWPRRFHALRASRETELAREFPIHVVTAWLGNTPRIALKHYLTVTEDDFSKAVSATSTNGNGSIPFQKTAPIAAQHVHAPSRTGSQSKKETPGRAGVYASSRDWVRDDATQQKRRGQDSNLR